jgi:hypothetical protein
MASFEHFEGLTLDSLSALHAFLLFCLLGTTFGFSKAVPLCAVKLQIQRFHALVPFALALCLSH